MYVAHLMISYKAAVSVASVVATPMTTHTSHSMPIATACS